MRGYTCGYEGKSSIIRRFIDETFEEILLASIGVTFTHKLITLDGKIIKLSLYDLSGNALASQARRSSTPSLPASTATATHSSSASTSPTLRATTYPCPHTEPLRLLVQVAGEPQPLALRHLHPRQQDRRGRAEGRRGTREPVRQGQPHQ